MFLTVPAGGGMVDSERSSPAEFVTHREVRMRTLVRTLVLLGIATMLPSVASAQATLAGTVKDASGAVLPGVSVEASSPVLIEKIRTTTTDSAGNYRIESLTPGTYTVTFGLSGFSTVKRE